jgi:threonine dehydratase
MDTETQVIWILMRPTKGLKGGKPHTPLEYNQALSEKYECEIYLKREDLQVVRSYKLSGAYNMISQLSHDRAIAPRCGLCQRG